jgi:hypothetical protein
MDLAAYQPQTADTVYVAALFTTTYPGRVITGTEKLAQRFILELMTDPDTMVYRPNRGGGLTEALNSGLSNESDVFYAFHVALIKTAANLQSEETDDDPDDERYDSATLTNLTIGNGSFSLQISLKSLAGTTINLIWPIVLTPRLIDGNDMAALETV